MKMFGKTVSLTWAALMMAVVFIEVSDAAPAHDPPTTPFNNVEWCAIQGMLLGCERGSIMRLQDEICTCISKNKRIYWMLGD